MLQVIITRGLRGTEVYRAADRAGAERIVRQQLAAMIGADPATQYARIHDDRPDGWIIKSGKFRNDTLQIVSVEETGLARYGLAQAYNGIADIASLDRGAAKLTKARNEVKAMLALRCDQDAALKRPHAAIQAAYAPWAAEYRMPVTPQEPCKACKGTGKDAPRFVADSFVILRDTGKVHGPRCADVPARKVQNDCTVCNGKGKL